ncbi:Oidioi.mRNA.OKI2018_I69.chr2.g4920.t1.cds [Oikopleura dioica]|uniref:Oidioi.mRNA.OKI2018_I69.chr2.g4920.t1.cds n=1 Tax=Oikopleura dioica TaxID=34765 RepID=A0ABN7T2K4_OIKDI|nr:Oidioi.mRNA.OKI2018_I69.chr2.g4920.t1.cds [Oikopleura dioica]
MLVAVWILVVHLHGYNTVHVYLRSRKDMGNLYENHRGRFFVAENSATGELLGTILWKKCKEIPSCLKSRKTADDFIELGSLMVKRNCRKLGVGKMLVNKIKEEAIRLDKDIFLVTSIHNQTADRFYQRNGLKRIAGDIYSFTRILYFFAWVFDHRSLFFIYETK